jgi:electron transport complex protein RnfG
MSATPAAWPVIRALAGTGTVCALIIVTVYTVTAPIITADRAVMRQQALDELWPDAAKHVAFIYTSSGRFEKLTDGAGAEADVYANYDRERRLLGFAIEAQGMGYQDRIRLLYGYHPYRQRIVGMTVLESRETPGLGSRIADDPGFQAGFRRLDVTLTADGTALQHPLRVVKPGEKNAAWQIDAISGATVSSNAVGAIINDSAALWLPRLRQHLEDFRIGP